MIGEWLARPLVRYGILVAIGAALVFGTMFVMRSEYNKGATAGGDKVKTAVQGETIKKLDDARTRKEKIDEEVRRTPLDDRIDGLR